MKSELFSQWEGFIPGKWCEAIDVREFIQKNYTPYIGDEKFLAKTSDKTCRLKSALDAKLEEEKAHGGVISVDTRTVSSLTNYPAAYLKKEDELIVGLQTGAPLERGVNPFGGIRMARSACNAYGYELSENIEREFCYRTTHNDGVFRVYTDTMRAMRHTGILTGLPDAYGRGRIIGDYRRVALYGIDYLIEQKQRDKKEIGQKHMTEENIRLSEELYKQISFLEKLKEMAALYEIDISKPASNAKEAVQWLYFGYLAANKEQNGAAMSLGRVGTFIDIYLERDIRKGLIDEIGAQELIDQLVMKLRMIRHLRTPEYNELFGGDPVWITEAVGGMGQDGRTLVTKTSYRFLHTLYNLGSAPEPNLTVLWSDSLPETFKRYCARVSIQTDSIQYENDDLMRPVYGDDYAIACCVSAMKIGKQMQFFGARCNLPKTLLMALNGGREERYNIQIGPEMEPMREGVLEYNQVKARLDYYMGWLAAQYVDTMNVIHFMHDKYAYEKTQLALHDTDVERVMAFGVAGLSVIADSLSAIKYAKVSPVIGDNGLICDFNIEGEYPTFGNDDDRVDTIASELLDRFITELRKNPAYRGAKHTLSVLTITSNVVYGKKTGSTPDGRKAGEPFAPGANPMHNREKCGALASLNSVAKLSYDSCRDGISNTFSIVPEALGKTEEERVTNLVTILGGYFMQNSHHINVNVLDRQKLIDAMDNPELYPNLTIRVSGYAVNFHKLSKEQQREVISRTFHDRI
ncbi:MAG: formate C-acetyltransferase [Clostridia bacterium]|nr:formate C-acetyltransferase [Clostridia bacterium]